MNTKLRPDEMDRLDVETFKKSEKFPVIVILDNIRSGNNIGSVFRTGDALRIAGVYLCGICAQPPQKDIQKTALGSTETVPWLYFENTIDAIAHAKKENYAVYAVEQAHSSIKLNNFHPEKNEKLALIMGNEVRGVQQEAIDACKGVIEIPQFGSKHSFNISVSTGIVLWDVFTKMTPF
jgi:23S rRNA (guanosine2251-2'-O)-methyltransferase